MSLKNIQQEINDWVAQFKEGYWPPQDILVRLMEEVGELAREVNHRFGSKKKKGSELSQELGEEIADVIFTLGCLANSQNINLDTEFTKMMNKLRIRDDKRFEKKY